MSKVPNIEVSETLIVKYLAGEASPDEAMAIDDWIATTADNQREFERLSRLWDQTGTPMSYRAPDLQQEWLRWEQQPQPAPATKIRRLNWQWAAAAAVLLIAGATLAYFLLQQHKKTEGAQIVRNTTATPLLKTLPDQSTVSISTGSSISYEEDFKAGRQIILKDGQAHFSVQPDPQHTFSVIAGELMIKVIGTAFTVKKTPDSVTVNVDNGAVMLTTTKDSLVLKAGMNGVYLVSNGILKQQDTGPNQHQPETNQHQPDTNQPPAATNIHRSLQFEDQELGTVIKQLEAAYGVHIVLSNPKLSGCRISTAFNDKPLIYVMDVICASMGLGYRTTKDTIYLDGYGCD